MAWVISFAGLAMLYGAVGSLIVLVMLLLTGHLRLDLLPVLFTTLTFLALTQHPLPDSAAMVCPLPFTSPQLVPFDMIQTIVGLYRRDAPMADWLTNRTIVAAIMNFALCIVIGATSAPHVVTWHRMLIFSFGLTFFVELTQLTGMWGLYPCAWRKFDVDDLIGNIAGVACGWIWMRCRLYVAK